MKLEITLSEIQSFLKNKLKKEIGLKQKNRSQVLIDIPYVLFILDIKEVNRHGVVLKYKAGSVLSSAKIWLFSSKVDEAIRKINRPILQFDKINSEILIDLRNDDKFKEVLNILSISGMYLANNSINIGLKFVDSSTNLKKSRSGN